MISKYKKSLLVAGYGIKEETVKIALSKEAL